MEYLERLEQSLKIFEDETDKISLIPVLIENVTNLVSEVNEEKREISAQYTQLSSLEKNIQEESKKIREYIEVEKESKSEFLSVVKNSLFQSSKENMELYNNLSKTMSNKIDVTESNLNAIVVKNTSNLVDELGDIRKKVKELEENVTEKTKKIDTDLEELKNLIPQVKQLQTLSIVSILSGVAACVLIIMRFV